MRYLLFFPIIHLNYCVHLVLSPHVGYLFRLQSVNFQL